MKPSERDAIRALLPGQTLTVDGVEIQRRPDGDLRYLINAVVDNRRIHRVVGYQSQGMNFHQARDHVERLRIEAREHRLAVPPKGHKQPVTLRAAAALYIARLKETNGKNIAKKEAQLAQHITRLLGDLRLAALDGAAIEKYRRTRRAEGAAPSTCNRELSVVSHLISVAVEAKWIAARPCAVRKEKEFRRHRIALTDEEAARLMAAAVEDIDQQCWLFVAFGLNTAMRTSEILSCRFEQVDFTGLRLHIPEAKAGQRIQPITPELRDVLLREREMADDPDGWIFPAVRAPLSAGGRRTRIDRSFARAVKAAGLTGIVTPHSMRHTAITKLIQAGVDLPTVQRISGHKTIGMVMEYAHVHAPHIDRAMRVLGKGLCLSLPLVYHDGAEGSEEPPETTAQVIDITKRRG
jgi:integrase